MTRSVALSGREDVRIDRPDYAAAQPPEPRPPLPVISVSALARQQTPGARERLEQLGRERASGHWPPHLAALRDRAAVIRRETLDDLPGHLDRLTEALTANGCTVHRVSTTAEAREVVGSIATTHGVRVATKVKSMASEKIHLNAHLTALGVEVVETDLGEYMVQLFDERPSHIVGPVLHRSQAEAMALFGDLTGQPVTDPQQIGPLARARLRADFRAATLGVCGVNFAAADTGTLVLVTNEGNADVVTSQVDVLVAIMPVEKVIARLSDIAVLVPLLSETATSEPITVYQTLLWGPRGPDEDDGPRELHVVIYDNGRTRWLGTPEAEALACIRCGNCQFSCPVYRTLGGGHAYGSVYGGPIGAVLSPLLADAGERDADLPFLSSLCGACADACPVRIPLPELLVRGRERYVRAATERGCRVVRAASRADAVAAVQELCAGRPTLVDDVPLLAGVTVGEPAGDPWSAEVGVTQAWAAASDTGTVALVRRAGFPRRTSILPLVSVVLVSADALLPTYGDLVEGVARLEPRPSNVQLVTGASRSGDVQGITLRGMHGPATLALVVH